jgi:hypothetical protein
MCQIKDKKFGTCAYSEEYQKEKIDSCSLAGIV